MKTHPCLLAVLLVPGTSSLPPAERIIALGDVHGDLQALRLALRAGRVVDENDKWIGGKTVVVCLLCVSVCE